MCEAHLERKSDTVWEHSLYLGHDNGHVARPDLSVIHIGYLEQALLTLLNPEVRFRACAGHGRASDTDRVPTGFKDKFRHKLLFLK